MIEEDSPQPDLQEISEGQIIEWDQDQWWLDGKTRVKKEKKFFQTKKGITLIVAFFVFVVVILGLMLRMGELQPVIEEEIVDEDLQQEWSQTSLQDQIRRLRAQLEKADPANRETPIPQVEMSIQIEME